MTMSRKITRNIVLLSMVVVATLATHMEAMYAKVVALDKTLRQAHLKEGTRVLYHGRTGKRTGKINHVHKNGTFQVKLDNGKTRLRISKNILTSMEIPQEVDNMKTKRDKLASKYSVMTPKYTGLKKKHEDMTTEYTVLKKKYEDMTSQYTGLTQEYEDMTSQYMGLTQECSKVLTDQMENLNRIIAGKLSVLSLEQDTKTYPDLDGKIAKQGKGTADQVIRSVEERMRLVGAIVLASRNQSSINLPVSSQCRATPTVARKTKLKVSVKKQKEDRKRHKCLTKEKKFQLKMLQKFPGYYRYVNRLAEIERELSTLSC